MRCSSTVISAGSAPARSRIASCDDSSGVKLPVMIPEPPEMCAWITGAEITCSSSTIANGLPMFSAVYAPKAAPPAGLKRKLTAGRLFWSKLGCASTSWSPVTTARRSST